MFSLHCTTCDATYLMGASALAAALSTGSAIETPSGTLIDVLCPMGHINTTGFNARIETCAGHPARHGVATPRSGAARLAV